MDHRVKPGNDDLNWYDGPKTWCSAARFSAARPLRWPTNGGTFEARHAMTAKNDI
jgi:hypothetical protein